MKIEELNYNLDGKEVDDKNFDIEKWRRENPIDYFKIIYLYLKLGENVNDELKNYIFMQIYKVTRLYVPDILFKYYSLNEDVDMNYQKLETLQQGKIFLSEIKNFNDPFDGKAFFYREVELLKYPELKACNGRLIDDFSSFVRSTSFSQVGVNSMPMWAHYANNHMGFCVSYDTQKNLTLKSNTFPIQYTEERLDITQFMDQYIQYMSERKRYSENNGLRKIELNDLSIVFLPTLLHNLKHISWSYEKEFRCSTAINAPGAPFVEAIPKEIFIGMKCKEEHKRRLKEIGTKFSIPVYEMRFLDDSNEYKLTYSEL